MRWPLLLLALGPASTALAQLPAPGDALVGLVAEDGALALDLARRSSGALWIANTGEGTVARFDTATREETGRFFTGPLGPGNDPSRTSVDPLGDAYVANRAGNRVTRIASQPEACPDRDGDGTIDTSWGRAALGWGADECVLWSTGLDAHLLGEDGLRAVAVQDGAGGDPFARFVWVGGYVSGQVAKLDAETGEVLFVVDAPVRPYGFALDGDDQLWIATRDGRRFGRIDTLACTGVERCAICDGEGVGDGCAAQRIAAPVVPYGVTVDGAGRVWLGARTWPATTRRRPWVAAGHGPGSPGTRASSCTVSSPTAWEASGVRSSGAGSCARTRRTRRAGASWRAAPGRSTRGSPSTTRVRSGRSRSAAGQTSRCRYPGARRRRSRRTCCRGWWPPTPTRT